MDSSHVALVSLNLKESAFTDFKCERPVPHQIEHIAGSKRQTLNRQEQP